MRTMSAFPVLGIALLVLGGCASGDPALRKNPSFQEGYEDGCQSVTDQGADLRSRTVGDKTGIAAEFDFQLTFTPGASTAPPDAAADPGPDIFAAMQEQLGLKLESAKGPVEVLVIDRVEKPSEN